MLQKLTQNHDMKNKTNTKHATEIDSESWHEE